MIKLLAALLGFCCFSFVSIGQDLTFFGKKNTITLHGSWFFRGIPQAFYKESFYNFSPSSQDLVERPFFNHVWHCGFTYKRAFKNQQAFGIQFDLSARNLGSPSFNLASAKTTISPFNHSVDGNAVWSENAEKFVKLTDLEISKTALSNKQFLVTWSKSRNNSVFPLGLISTFGLGVQLSALQVEKSLYGRSHTSNSLGNLWSNNLEVIRINKPQNFDKRYLGFVWMWDLSLNYALNKNTLFSIGSDIRGVFGVFQQTKTSDIMDYYSLTYQGVPSLEALVYGRNLRKEIAKEMRFQNTIKLGVSWVF